ncbi:MAG: glycosyltransferase [Treponema sp.]|nr:glycosyltransferase [Treponema sp.]
MENLKINNSLFSVIVPVYGVKDYLPKCIESVLNQTFSDYELILVDDGSIDGSGLICDDYAEKDNRIRVIHKENGGLVSARKAGASESTGDYIVCVDGDDFIGPEYLKKISNCINETHADLIMDGCVWWKSDTDFVTAKVSDGYYGVPLETGFYDRSRMEKEVFPNLIENKKSKNIQNSVWGKAFKRELYVPVQLSVQNSIHMAEDTCVVKPVLFNAQSFAVLDNAEYYYRQTEASMTRSVKSYKWEAPEIISRHLENLIDMSFQDMQEQVYRNCVHLLFNVCRAHKSFKGMKTDYYKTAVKKARFSFGTKGWLARLVLSIMI